MRIEWTSYQSPVGVLTILEAREGPLIVEFAERTGRLNLAERLRERAPGAIIDTGPCRQATSWLTAYFAGRPRPFADCPDDLDTVGGCDLTTYRNPCDAARHGESVAHAGHCAIP